MRKPLSCFFYAGSCTGYYEAFAADHWRPACKRCYADCERQIAATGKAVLNGVEVTAVRKGATAHRPSWKLTAEDIERQRLLFAK